MVLQVVFDDSYEYDGVITVSKYILNIYYTSDVHGAMIPYNFATRGIDLKGLSRLKTFLKDVQNDYLLLDNGDMLQGSPLTNYWIQKESHTLSPPNLIMNDLNYDYATLGNHDFNFGERILWKYVKDLKATVVSCNIFNKDGSHAFSPYEIKVMPNGVRIGIIGAVTQAIPNWEKPEHIKHFQFEDAFEAIKRQVEIIKPLVDCIVVLYHGGIERHLESGQSLGRETSENKGYKIANELDIDVLLTGHQHMPRIGKVKNCLVLQPSHSAYDFGEVQLTFEHRNNQWTLLHSHGRLIPMTAKSDLGIEQLIESLKQKTDFYLDQVLVTADGESLLIGDPFEARLLNHPLFKIVNDAQLWKSKADLSCASLPNSIPGLNHQITLRDLETTFIYPNTSFVIEVTGKSLKSAIERSAEYFLYDGKSISVNPLYVYPKLEHYNYDIYSGIIYELTISNPIGQRVTKLEYHGKPVREDQLFRVVMNNYRAMGGGEYPMFNNSKIVQEINMTTAELVIEYFVKHPKLSVELLHNPTVRI